MGMVFIVGECCDKPVRGRDGERRLRPSVYISGMSVASAIPPIQGPQRMSHPPPKVNAMRRNRRPPSETSQEICARVRSITAACLVDLRRLVGPDLSRAEVGEAAEAVKQIEARAPSRNVTPSF